MLLPPLCIQRLGGCCQPGCNRWDCLYKTGRTSILSCSIPAHFQTQQCSGRNLQALGTKRLVLRVVVHLRSRTWEIHIVQIGRYLNPHSTLHWCFRWSWRYRWTRHRHLRRLCNGSGNTYVQGLAGRQGWRNDNFFACHSLSYHFLLRRDFLVG